MKSAREEFGPPPQQQGQQNRDLLKLLESSQIKNQVQGIGKDLQQAGVKPEGHSHLNLVKDGATNEMAAKKDLTVPQGDRPALTPCDGNLQVKEAGQTLHNTGVKGGESVSPEQAFSKPGPTPEPPSQSTGGRTH